jgi:hypothetical protein
VDSIVERHSLLSFISGGEPLLYEKLSRLLEVLSSQSIAVHLITNGTLLSGAIVQQLSKFPMLKLYISCHERWAQTKSLLKRVQIQLQNPIVVSQIVTPKNLHEVESLSRFCSDIGCQFLPQLLGSIYDDTMYARSYFSFTAHQCQIVEGIFSSNGRLIFLERWRHWHEKGSLVSGCPNRNRVMIVYPSMNVYSCFFNGELGLVGNLGRATASQIWKHFDESRLDVSSPGCARVECNCLLEMPETDKAYQEIMNARQG